MKPFIKLIISLIIPLAVGAVSAVFTMRSVQTWYPILNKPFFNPPNWIFAPVWTVLYIMMGIAFYIIWKKPWQGNEKRTAITVYFIQLLLNFAWSAIFFYFHRKGWALAEISVLWIMIVITIRVFGKISRTAAWLLIPYIIWVSFACLLTYAIWQLN